MARYDSGFFYDSGVHYDEEEAPPLIHHGSMITLSRFLINPFDDAEISLDELLSFATDHLQRLIANNPGALFNALITATTPLLTVLMNCTSDDQVKLGIRKARKLAKDAFRKGLVGKVEMLAAAVVAKFGKQGAEYMECFPQGRTVYKDSTDDHLEGHLTQLHTALAAHAAALGPQAAADAAGLLSTWTVVYAASESSTGSKTTTEAGKQQARENLQLRLFLNLLEIARLNARHPEALDLYMRQSLLENPTPAVPPVVPPPTP